MVIVTAAVNLLAPTVVLYINNFRPFFLPFRYTSIQAATGSASLLLVFLVKTFVMACRMVTPAFSISFFDSPVVMQTFNAG
jgi:hypothetical protein